MSDLSKGEAEEIINEMMRENRLPNIKILWRDPAPDKSSCGWYLGFPHIIDHEFLWWKWQTIVYKPIGIWARNFILLIKDLQMTSLVKQHEYEMKEVDSERQKHATRLLNRELEK